MLIHQKAEKAGGISELLQASGKAWVWMHIIPSPKPVLQASGMPLRAHAEWGRRQFQSLKNVWKTAHAALLTLETLFFSSRNRWFAEPYASHYSSEFSIYDNWTSQTRLRWTSKWLKGGCTKQQNQSMCFQTLRGLWFKPWSQYYKSFPSFLPSLLTSTTLLSSLWLFSLKALQRLA